MERSADVVVIGSGPGGEGAAMQLAKSGMNVLMVEKYEKVGGGCTHWGTIPSKALRTAIFQAGEALNHPLIVASGTKARPTVKAMGLSAQRIIDAQVEMRRKFYTRNNNVEVVSGHALFVDDGTISVDGTKSGYSRIAAVIWRSMNVSARRSIQFTRSATWSDFLLLPARPTRRAGRRPTGY